MAGVKTAFDPADIQPMSAQSDDGRMVVDAVVRACHAEVMRILRARLRHEEDAADLAQEAYARLLRYRGGESEGDLRRLLFRIVDNLLTDHWRWKHAHPEHEAAPIEDALPAMTVESTQDRYVEHHERVALLKQAVLALPPKCRRVFLLSRIQGRSNPEIARICGISVKMVEKHITHALAVCRAQVGDPALDTLYTGP